MTSDEESSEDEGSGVGTRGRGRDEVEKSIATYQRNTSLAGKSYIVAMYTYTNNGGPLTVC